MDFFEMMAVIVMAHCSMLFHIARGFGMHDLLCLNCLGVVFVKTMIELNVIFQVSIAGVVETLYTSISVKTLVADFYLASARQFSLNWLVSIFKFFAE